MIIEAFEADGFRNLAGLRLRPHPVLNLVIGANGAGKSSLLEAIQCLATGVGFRSRRYRDHLAHGADEYVLRAELAESPGGRTHRCGVRRGRDGEFDARLDYEPVGSFADIARVLPVKVLGPDSHLLVQGAPDERRRFLDWGCFHGGDAFLPLWRRYRRALSQRNELLRDGAPDVEVRVWDAALARDGAALQARRAEYVLHFARHVKIRAQSVDFPFHVKLDLRPGWPRGLSLAEALERNLDAHRRLRTTADGPHRAELAIRAGEHAARDVLSRGQQKLLVYLLHLAQLDALADGAGGDPAPWNAPAAPGGDGDAKTEGAGGPTGDESGEPRTGRDEAPTGPRAPAERARAGAPPGGRPVVLCDDLLSELDERAGSSLLDALVASGSQVFVSGTRLPAAFDARAADGPATLAAGTSDTTLEGTETLDPQRPWAVFTLDAGRLLG